MHGIFPIHNKYYIHTEIFPHLTKQEIKDVYYAPKKVKDTKNINKRHKEDNEE